MIKNLWRIIVFLFVGLLFYYIRPSTLLFFLPGLVFFRFSSGDEPLIDRLIKCIFLSLACWIISFWFIALFNIDLFYFSTFIIALSFIVFIYVECKAKTTISLSLADFVIAILLVIVAYIYIYPLNNNLSLPNDLATNSFMARIIVENRGFTPTFKPIWDAPGFGSNPLGFSTMNALMTMIEGNNVPIYRTGAYLGCLNYVFLIMGLYYALRVKYSQMPAFLGAFLACYLCGNHHHFIWFGGQLNLLSMALTIAGARLLFEPRKDLRIQQSFILAAGALTHFIPIMFIFIISIIYIVYLLIINYKSTISIILKLYTIPVTIVALSIAPFLYLVKVNVSTFEKFLALYWQLLHGPNLLNQNLWSYPIRFYEYLKLEMGSFFLFYFVIGLIITIYVDRKATISAIIMTIIILFLILNSFFWWLPLSFAFLPDRIITFLILPCGIMWASVIRTLFQYLSNTWMKCVFGVTFYFVVVLPGSYVVYNSFYQNIQKNNSLTQADLRAFEWIEKNISPESVIYNSQADAGIWIPAITCRPIACPHTNVAIREELMYGAAKKPMRYIYRGKRNIMFGKKSVKLKISHNVFITPEFQQVPRYRRDGVTVFEITQSIDKEEKIRRDGGPIQLFSFRNENKSIPFKLRWDPGIYNLFNCQFSLDKSFELPLLLFQTYPDLILREPQYTPWFSTHIQTHIKDKLEPFSIFVRIQGVRLEDGRVVSTVGQSEPYEIVIK